MKSFKFGVLADIHFDLFPNVSVLREDMLTDRICEIGAIVLDAFSQMVKEGVLECFILGDVFHRRNLRPDAVNNYVRDIIYQGTQLGLNITILVGNHDQAHLKGAVHSLESLKQFCTVIDTPTIKNYSGFDIYLCPYEEYKGVAQSLELLLKRGKNSNRLLMSHCGVTGAKLSGFDSVSKEPLSVKDLCTDQFIYTYLGHYHMPQDYLEEKFSYVGSPCQHSLSDKVADRGCMIVEVELVKCDWKARNKRITLDSPKFIEVSADEYDPKNYIGKNYIKVTDCDRKQVEKLQTDTNVMSTTGVKLERVVDDKKAIQIDLGWSEMLEKYVEITEPKKKNHKRLIKTGSEFIE